MLDYVYGCEPAVSGGAVRGAADIGVNAWEMVLSIACTFCK
jgi:hypothetical protein